MHCFGSNEWRKDQQIYMTMIAFSVLSLLKAWSAKSIVGNSINSGLCDVHLCRKLSKILINFCVAT
jgi:hypothetical protein